MLATALDAKARLEAAGLHVSLCSHGSDSLFIAAGFTEFDDGLKISQDASVLDRNKETGRWLVTLPGEGGSFQGVEGDLPDVVALIEQVYHHYRNAGGKLRDAVREVLGRRIGTCLNGDPIAVDFRDVPGAAGYVSHETMWDEEDVRTVFIPLARSLGGLARQLDSGTAPVDYFDAIDARQ